VQHYPVGGDIEVVQIPTLAVRVRHLHDVPSPTHKGDVSSKLCCSFVVLDRSALRVLLQHCVELRLVVRLAMAEEHLFEE
jgi:hypothetical protein